MILTITLLINVTNDFNLIIIFKKILQCHIQHNTTKMSAMPLASKSHYRPSAFIQRRKETILIVLSKISSLSQATSHQAHTKEMQKSRLEIKLFLAIKGRMSEKYTESSSRVNQLMIEDRAEKLWQKKEGYF